MNGSFEVGDKVQWDTFEGPREGTVTALGAYWVEVDGRLMGSHTVLIPAR